MIQENVSKANIEHLVNYNCHHYTIETILLDRNYFHVMRVFGPWVVSYPVLGGRSISERLYKRFNEHIRQEYLGD